MDPYLCPGECKQTYSVNKWRRTDLVNQTPQKLTELLVLGLSDLDENGPTQFTGSIANVNVFQGNISTEIRQLTKDMCTLEAEIVNSDLKAK